MCSPQVFHHLSARDGQPARKGNKRGYVLPPGPRTPFPAYASAQATQKRNESSGEGSKLQ